MRARSWTIRDGFADVLRGLHIREEVDDFIETGGLWPQLLASAQEGAQGGLHRNGAARPHRTPLEPREPLPDLGAAGSGAAATQAPKAEAPAVSGSVDEPAAVASAEPETPTASASIEPETAAPEESFTLADAEGGFVDVKGAEALQAEFERLFSDPHLSPDQILGLWESNEAARLALARRFGPAALAPAEERLAAARNARAGQRDDRAPVNGDGEVLSTPSVPEPAAGRVRRRWAVQRPRASQREATPRSAKPVSSQGDPGPAARAANLAASVAETAAWNRSASAETRPGGENRGAEPVSSPGSEPHRPGLDVCGAPTGPVAELAISIDPSWGDQRVFRHYRAYLAALRRNGSSQPPDIAGLRAANSAIEDRLRQRLPGMMQQLDALYGAEAPLPGSGEDSAC
jgi:hypothetical protein